CVKNVEKALSAVENIDVFIVTKTELNIYGAPKAEEVIAAIVGAGYEASLTSENNTSPKSELSS
ncbi:MAG TPA: hypothetical protein DD638_01700, partial [Pasteurellaceae bacterium]|nr:hypothetical protein [Pasteurellaceae bacterium]